MKKAMILFCFGNRLFKDIIWPNLAANMERNVQGRKDDEVEEFPFR